MIQKHLVTSKFQTKIGKSQREIKKKICRLTIRIHNYYFRLLFVARKNFCKFSKLLAGMVTKVHP